MNYLDSAARWLLSKMAFTFVVLTVYPANAVIPLEQLPSGDSPALRAAIDQGYALMGKIPLDWWNRAPSVREIPKPVMQEAAQLMERLLTWPGATRQPAEHEEGLFKGWRRALEYSFRVQFTLGRTDPTSDLSALDEVLAHLGPTDSAPGKEARAQMSAEMSNCVFVRWCSLEPQLIVPRVLEFEKRWITPLGGTLPTWWLDLRVEYASAILLHWPAASSGPLAGDAGINSQLTVAAVWLRDYLNNASLPFRTRLSQSTSLAQLLHSFGRAEEAAAIMDTMRAVPNGADLHDDPAWLCQRFSIAQAGQGDRALARSLLSRMDALISDGKITAENEDYQRVLFCYYHDLPQPDLAHNMKTAEILSECRARYPLYPEGREKFKASWRN